MKPTRLRMVEGDAPQARMRKTLSAFKCTKCTEELGMVAHTMVQVLRSPHEANGKLVAGSLWWACGRCLTPYYYIRMFGHRR